MASVAIVGECMLELSRCNGEAESFDGVLGAGFEFAIGGDTFNTAVYLARCGVPVEYISVLGDDPFSSEVFRFCKDEGIGTRHLRRAKGRLPGLYLIENDLRGERRFHYWRSHSPARELFRFFDDESLLAAVSGHDYLYLTGITLSILDEEGRARLIRVIDLFRAAGGKLVFDSNYRVNGWQTEHEAQRAIGELVARTDIALPTLCDEMLLFHDPDLESCISRYWNAGASEVAIKRGAESTIGLHGSEFVEIEPPAVDPVVDTTAAGDAFNAAYLAARIHSASLPAAIRDAQSCASLIIQHRGAILPRHVFPG